jgi:hypothetical protein
MADFVLIEDKSSPHHGDQPTYIYLSNQPNKGYYDKFDKLYLVLHKRSVLLPGEVLGEVLEQYGTPYGSSSLGTCHAQGRWYV